MEGYKNRPLLVKKDVINSGIGAKASHVVEAALLVTKVVSYQWFLRARNAITNMTRQPC